MASRRRDRIDKLRRLATSPNPHEAASAAEEVARLLALEPAPVRPGGRDLAYPHQLPAAIRIPTPLGRG